MSVAELLEIHQQGQRGPEHLKMCEKFAKQFPFCTAFQSLYYYQLSEPTQQQQQRQSLQRNNVFLFSYDVARFGKQQHAVTAEPVEIDEQDASLESDIIEPLITTDYFAAQNISTNPEDVSSFIKEQREQRKKPEPEPEIDEDQQMMVTRTFTEWLTYFRKQKEKTERERADKDRVRSMWQKEKLTAAAEEDDDVVPEQVFTMAMNSINRSSDTVSETLAKVLAAQGKTEKATEMYRKLSLLHPEKSAYFAAQIKKIQE